MPTLDEIIKQKMARLQSVPDALVSSADKAQEAMLKKAQELISQMDIVDGKFEFTKKNIQLIEQIGNSLQGEIFSDQYVSDLTSYAKEFNSQATINNSYFSKLSNAFEPDSLYSAVVKQSQKNALDLLGQDAVTAEIISPIKNSLLGAITNGGTFSETLATITEISTNTEAADGILTRYVKRVAYDAFAVSDRQYTKAISEDLGLVFYKYQGGETSDTRCFCEERKGGYYHKKEIQSWGRGQHIGSCAMKIKGAGNKTLWQGANYATDENTIFSFVGGYSCKDSLLPYITTEVPDKWIQRAINLGFYSPN